MPITLLVYTSTIENRANHAIQITNFNHLSYYESDHVISASICSNDNNKRLYYVHKKLLNRGVPIITILLVDIFLY